MSDPSNVRLIGFGPRPSTGMSHQAPARPLFAVPSPATASRSVDEHVKALGAVCHVVETQKGASGWTYALVHASPLGVARIAQELNLEVFRSKRGEEYYAVVVAKAAQGSTPQSVVRPVPQAPAFVPSAPAAQAPLEPGVARCEIRGSVYRVRQTRTKRQIDVLRFEVAKDQGDVITEPYVVSFQDQAGRSGACSCPDWIYRRREKGDCKHIHGIREAFVKPRQQTIPLGNVG